MSAVQIVKANDALLAYMAAASGDFKAETKKLSDLIAEWDKRSSIGDREKAMKALSDSVAADIAKNNAIMAAQKTATASAMEKNKERVAAIDAQELEIQTRMSELSAREAAQCAAQEAAEKAAATRTQALAAQASVLEKKQEVLAQREAALSDRELALRNATDSMRALVA
jgi:hypothetical protein